LHRRLWENAVEVPGPLTDRLSEAAVAAGAWVAIGVNEREASRPGSLWNTLVWLGPDGSVRRHRKLVPTMHERVFWGQGAGDVLDRIATDIGRLGGLICWENYMPAARRRLHLGGVDFYLAPTADDRDIWAASMRAFAFEAGAFVLSPVQYLTTADFPDDFPLRDELAGGVPRGPLLRREPHRRSVGQPARRAGARRRGDHLRGLRPGRDPRGPAGARHRRPLRPRGHRLLRTALVTGASRGIGLATAR